MIWRDSANEHPPLRRPFLALAPALAIGRTQAAPSDRIRLGFIACGGRARYLMRVFQQFPDVTIAAVCDPIEPRMAQARELLAQPPRPQTRDAVVDYRRILDRKDIDAVVIATTEHWHAAPSIHAAQAGKPLFVEKPLSHAITEGRTKVAAARKYGVPAMMGTQQVGGLHFQKAVEVVQSGRLGKIGLVECWTYHNTGKRVGRAEDYAAPQAGTGICGSARRDRCRSTDHASHTRGGSIAAGA